MDRLGLKTLQREVDHHFAIFILLAGSAAALTVTSIKMNKHLSLNTKYHLSCLQSPLRQRRKKNLKSNRSQPLWGAQTSGVPCPKLGPSPVPAPLGWLSPQHQVLNTSRTAARIRGAPSKVCLIYSCYKSISLERSEIDFRLVAASPHLVVIWDVKGVVWKAEDELL